jgi:hypothetical protein
MEQILSEMFDLAIEEQHFELARESLNNVRTTFSRYDEYLKKVNDAEADIH